MSMRVLFIPQAEGGPAHIIPLMALNAMLKRPVFETAFLVPRFIHKFLRQFGANVLDVDQQGWDTNGFRSELRAYKLFSPDVVVDDASLTTLFATAFSKVPRVAIQRTGIFPNYRPRNSEHRHSMNAIDLSKLADVTFLGIRQPTAFTDLFDGECKIVPGIRSIEVLPAELQSDPSYVYSGPLLMDDYLMEKVGLQDLWTSDDCLDINNCNDFGSLERFFAANKNRKVVYATFGTMAKIYEQVRDCIRFLLDSDIAVVTTIKVPELTPQQQELYYYARYLPMHVVCSHVDLVVHQCGSATYHYPLMHQRPSITIGTRCYDRDDVAWRLRELGVSVHLPAPEECADFVATFKDHVHALLNESGDAALRRKEKLAALNDEINQTVAAFNFEQLLHSVLESSEMRLEFKL